LFVTQAGKPDSEAAKNKAARVRRPKQHIYPSAFIAQRKAKKEQVVETTCGSHEKTSKDNLF